MHRGGQRPAPAVGALHPRALAPARRECVGLRGEARRLGALQSPLDLSLPVHQLVHPPPQLLLRRTNPRDLSWARCRAAALIATATAATNTATNTAAAAAAAAAAATRHRAHGGLPRRLPQPRTHQQPPQCLTRARRVRRVLSRECVRRCEAAPHLLLLAVAVSKLQRLVGEEVA